MPMLVVVRPLPGTLRCAACHDDLTERRYACPGCHAVLHRDCRADLTRCPTYGCSTITVADRRARLASEGQQRQQRGLLFHLVWLVPGLLSFLWPVWFMLLGHDSAVALVSSLVVGPLVGHAFLAPWSRGEGDPGAPQSRAMIAEMVGFGASVPALAVAVVALIAKACS